MAKKKPSLSNRLLKELITQVNRGNVATERQIGAILTLIDVMEKKDDRQYFEIKRLTSTLKSEQRQNNPPPMRRHRK